MKKYGRWAVVTGASDGIGRAFARKLADRGWDLVLVARRRSVLETMAAEFAARGRSARVIACDLGAAGGVERVLAETADLDAGLLVAAAGFGTSGDFVEADLAAEKDMLAVNCAAPLALAHEFGRRFERRGGGGIVLLSSLLAFQGVPRAAHYAATKAYIQTLAEGLRPEFAARGVDLIACAPGPVASGFGARAGMKMGMASDPDAVVDGTFAALGRRTTVRPGPLSAALAWSLAPLPRGGRSAILARVMRAMTPGAS